MAKVTTSAGKAKKVGDRRLRQRAAERKAKRTQAEEQLKLLTARRAQIESMVTGRYGPVQHALQNELRHAQSGGTAAKLAWDDYNAKLQANRPDSAKHFEEQLQNARTLGAQVGTRAQTTGQDQATAAAGRQVQGGQEGLGNQIAALLGAYGATYQQDAQAGATGAQQRHDAAIQQGAYQGVEAQRAAQAQVTGVQSKMTDLLREMGAYRVSAEQELDAADFERQIAAETLGLKQAGHDLNVAKLQEAITARQADDTRADKALDLKGQELAAKIHNWTETRKLKDKEINQRGRAGSLTAAKKDQWRSKKARVLAIAKAYKGLKNSGKFDHTSKIAVRLKSAGYSKDEINMARDLAELGYLSTANESFAKGYFPGGIVPQGFIARRAKPKKKK